MNCVLTKKLLLSYLPLSHTVYVLDLRRLEVRSICSIADMMFDNFIGCFDTVISHIQDIEQLSPSEGHDVMQQFINDVADIMEPVTGDFQPVDAEYVNNLDTQIDALNSFGNWAGLDVSDAVDMAMQLDSVFTGFSDVLVEVGNTYADSMVLDTDQPQVSDVEMPTDMTDASPIDTALNDIDILNSDNASDTSSYDNTLNDVADKMESLGDMFERVENLTDAISDMDTTDLLKYAIGG